MEVDSDEEGSGEEDIAEIEGRRLTAASDRRRSTGNQGGSMDAPAPITAATRTGAHFEGNSCCKNCCIMLECEPAWSRKPLTACCCCVGPLRWGSFLATATTTLISITVMLPVFVVLRAKTLFKDESIEEYKDLPFSVLLLRHVYNAFMIWALLTGVWSIVVLRAIKRNEAGVPMRIVCGSPPALFLSRLLRIGAYLFCFAFLFTRFHSHSVCLNYAIQEEHAAYTQACTCQTNATGLNALTPDGRCAPQNYVLCEPPDSPALQDPVRFALACHRDDGTLQFV